MGNEPISDDTAEVSAPSAPPPSANDKKQYSAAQLKQCFDQLSKCRDATERQCKLLQKAAEWDIPHETFAAMFQNYRQEKSWHGQVTHWWKRLPEIAGSVSIILGLILFILEADSRKQRANDQSWSIVIAAQRAQSGSKDGDSSHLGRIAALESLNKGCREKKAAEDRSWMQNYLLPWHWGFWKSKCATLRGLWLEGVHLPAIELPSATLRNTNFRKAGLWSANFANADLSDATLESAQLNEAILTETNLTGADLSNATLESAQLNKAILEETNLTNVDLAVADLSRVILTRADLTAADLSQTNLVNADLTGAILTEATLSDANLASAILLGTDLRGTKNLSPEQLQGEQPPYICHLRLPQGLEIDPDRDCGLLPEVLSERYPGVFDDITKAEKAVANYGQ
ncbi:MAG: pentapeptide repeat-containing protein [Cyanobacteria bacterium P01_B01_bin.77]